MPRNVTVTFEDGTSHTYQGVPDSATPEQVTERAQTEMGRRVVALDGGKTDPVRQAKLAAGSALKGVAGFPALAMDATEALARNAAGTKQAVTGGWPQLAATALARLTQGQSFGDRMQGVEQGADSLVGATPQTPNEKRVDSVVQGVTGALGPGAAAAPIRSMFAGAAGGAGGQAAAEFFNDDPVARLVGSMLGSTGGGMVGNFVGGTRPQVKNIAKEAGEGLTPEMLGKAKLFMEKAAAEGVKVDLAQALDAIGAPANNVKTIRDILANTNAGNKTQELLRGQPQAYQARAQLGMLDLPGNVISPSDAANRVQEAATSAIEKAKKGRTASVQADYAAAGELSKETRKAFADVLNEFLNKPGASTPAVAAVRDAMVKMKVNPATGAPSTHALDFDTIISDLTGPFRGTPMSPADPKAAGQIKALAAKLNAVLKDGSPEIAAAEAKFGKISKEVVDPLKQSSVGVMATKRGYMPDTQASVAKLEQLFSTGTDPASAGAKSDILTLAKELNKVDKNAFPDAAKTFISGRLAQAFEPELSGVPGASSNAAQAVWNALFANRKQWQGMRDMAAGIADAHGLPRKDVVDGLETLATLTKALKNRPGSVGGLDPKEVKELGGASRAANVARVYGFLPFERVARKLEDAQLNATFKKFDEILTTPEGALLLTKIGKRSVMDPEVMTLLQGFKSTAASGYSPGNMQE